MAVDPGTAYLVAVAVIVVTMLIISIFCGGKSKKQENAARAAHAAPRAREDNAPPGRRVRRRVNRNRMQMRAGESDDDEAAPPSEEEMDDIADEYEGKIGAKKLRKLQDKAEKKRQREMELQEREEKKEREKKLEAQRKKEEERQKAEEAVRAEEERLRKEEQERKEHEEYLKMKEMFSVDEEGQEETVDLDSQSLLQEFINYIKDMKVVMLEDLAAHFKIKTSECISRIQDLQADGKLTGVVDDRGKFIYITMEELESVAKYIRQLGRVSISELAESSNRLINLNPDNADVHKKLIVGDSPDLVEVST